MRCHASPLACMHIGDIDDRTVPSGESSSCRVQRWLRPRRRQLRSTACRRGRTRVRAVVAQTHSRARGRRRLRQSTTTTYRSGRRGEAAAHRSTAPSPLHAALACWPRALRFGLHAVLDGFLIDGLARYSGSVQRHAATATAERCASCTRPALVRRERNWMWRSPDGVYWRTRLCWEATHRLQPGTRHEDDSRSYIHRTDVARRTPRSAALAVLLRLRRPSRSESPLGFHAASTWPAAAGCGFGNSDAGGLGCYAAVLRPPGARRSAGKTTRKRGGATMVA